MSDYFIGLSTSGHDPAFAIADSTGCVVFAEATERFTQTKRAWGIAPDYVSHIGPEIDKIIQSDSNARFYIANSWKKAKADLPIDSFSGLIPSNLGRWMLGLQSQRHHSAGDQVRSLYQERVVGTHLNFDHHLCHAANGVYSAPFGRGLVLVADGEGEVGSVSLFRLNEGQLKRIWRSWGPGSFGAFYAWITQLCGFDWVAGEEWKVMGLAAYGQADENLVEQLERVLLIEDGRPVFADSNLLDEIKGFLQSHLRLPDQPVMNAANLAASGQMTYQRLMDRMLAPLVDYQEENLIISGGCALNSSYNGTLLSSSTFKQIHVPPAPADDGNAIGAALLAYQQITGKPLPNGESSAYLGSMPDRKSIQSVLKHSKWRATQITAANLDVLVQKLIEGNIIGLFRERAEFGPRALGHRSIIADPRKPNMKDLINKKVKFREPYRPFAPMILETHQADWFELSQPSPFMSFALRFKQENAERVPAVVHQDRTGRLQSVSQTSEPWLFQLLTQFHQETGVPILLNTSLNVMGKPIVHSVEDAVAVLATTGLDALVLGDYLIEK